MFDRVARVTPHRHSQLVRTWSGPATLHPPHGSPVTVDLDLTIRQEITITTGTDGRIEIPGCFAAEGGVTTTRPALPRGPVAVRLEIAGRTAARPPLLVDVSITRTAGRLVGIDPAVVPDDASG